MTKQIGIWQKKHLKPGTVFWVKICFFFSLWKPFSGILPLRNHPYVWQRASLNKGKMLSSPLIDLYSFSNDLISQHNVIGFRGPLHIYDGKLLNIYNPNEISWGRDIEKMKGERRFAFIPAALPHCTPLPLPPTSSLSFSFSFLHTFFPPFNLSLNLFLNSCLFLPRISHQCPLWSIWVWHPTCLNSTVHFCQWHSGKISYA